MQEQRAVLQEKKRPGLRARPLNTLSIIIRNFLDTTEMVFVEES